MDVTGASELFKPLGPIPFENKNFQMNRFTEALVTTMPLNSIFIIKKKNYQPTCYSYILFKNLFDSTLINVPTQWNEVQSLVVVGVDYIPPDQYSLV